jgi:sec-independent protein translocase protein TatA
MDALAPWHIVVIAVVAAVLFFGWKQLPDMSRSLGRSLRIFKTELKGTTSDASEPDAPAQPVAAARPVAVANAVRPRPVVTSDLDR